MRNRRTGLKITIYSALLPITWLLHFYNRNNAEIDLGAFLIAAGIITLFFVAAGGVLRLLSRSTLAAGLIVTLIFIAWISLNPVIELTGLRIRYTLLLTGAVLTVFSGGLFFLARGKPFPDSLISWLLVTLAVVGLVNTVEAAGDLVSPAEGPRGAELPLKEDFISDPAAGKPSIYWIHADGMLSFAAMEKYFGEAQPEFTAALRARGFGVNRGANFPGKKTTAFALAVLFNPRLYDLLLSRYVDGEIDSKLNDILAHARAENELMRALGENYRTVVIAHLNPQFGPLLAGADRFYDLEMTARLRIDAPGAKNTDQIVRAAGIMDLLDRLLFKNFSRIVKRAVFKPERIENPIPVNGSRFPESGLHRGIYLVETVQCLHEAMTTTGRRPGFFFISYDLPHFPYCYDEQGCQSSTPDDNIDRYPGHHGYSAQVLVNLIDFILKEDPEAVIVIQADHGLHGVEPEKLQSYFQRDEAGRELGDSVISALRVPDRFRTGEEVAALENPLNISRYLVNSFIGDNYDYLEPNPRLE